MFKTSTLRALGPLPVWLPGELRGWSRMPERVTSIRTKVPSILRRVGQVKTPRLIGKGQDGLAYLLSNGRVLKLTWDAPEAQAAENLRRAGVHRCTVQVFDVFEIAPDPPYIEVAYAIVQELLYPPDPTWLPLLNALTDFLHEENQFVTNASIASFLKKADPKAKAKQKTQKRSVRPKSVKPKSGIRFQNTPSGPIANVSSEFRQRFNAADSDERRRMILHGAGRGHTAGMTLARRRALREALGVL